MNIRLFSFSKKPNSTKRPGMDSGNLFDCTLIENTSVINPTIRLKAPESLIGIETVTLSNQSIVHITDGASGQPCPSVVASIVPVQTGSGTPSPSNVRPISGFSSAVLTRDQGTGTTPTTYTAALGQTVYGGSIDFVSGALSDEWNALYMDGSVSVNAVSYHSASGLYFVSVAVSIGASGNTSSSNINLYSDKFEVATGVAIGHTYISGSGNILVSVLPDQTITTKEQANQWFSNNPTTFVYKKATADTYTLTPQTITTAQGVNNFYADTGDILTFTYKRYVSTPAGKIYNLNYAYIDELQRYYWIRDIRYELGTWVFDLDIDVLASWKTKIGQSSEYVLRSASEKDDRIIDTMYPTMSQMHSDVQTATFNLFSSNNTQYLNPCYLLSIVGPNHVADGMLASTTYYVLSKSDLEALCYAMMDNVDWTGIDTAEISYALQKQLINPYQYFVDCKLLPWTPDVITASGETPSPVLFNEIPLGFNTFTIAAEGHGWKMAKYPYVGTNRASVSGLIKHFSNVMNVTKNPDSNTIGDWVNHTPFTQMDIYVEPFGKIPIPDSVISQYIKGREASGGAAPSLVDIPIRFDVTCDAIEGTVRLELSVADPDVILNPPDIVFFSSTVKVGCSIPLYRTQQNVTGAIESFTNAASSAVNLTNPIGGGIAAAGHIMDGFSKIMPELQGNGTMGSMVDCLWDLTTPRVVKKYATFVEFNNADNGSPLCKVKTLNTLSGFIQCQDSHFASEATAQENEAIINYLNGGFFYE